MKKYLLLAAISIAVFSNASAIELDECTIDCAGFGAIETKAEELTDEFYFGLRFIQDSLGNHQYFLCFKIDGEKHVISPNRVALLAFDKKLNKPIMEIKAAYQVSGNKKSKSWQYKFMKNAGGIMAGSAVAANGVSMMDDEDRYIIEPLSNTYYPLSDSQLQDLLGNNVVMMRFDTSDKLIDISVGGNKLSKLLKESYDEIQKCLTKDVYSLFNESTTKTSQANNTLPISFRKGK